MWDSCQCKFHLQQEDRWVLERAMQAFCNPYKKPSFLHLLAKPSVRELIFSIVDALIGRQPIAVASGGGGGNSDSDLRWDGRRPDEEEEICKKCLLLAIGIATEHLRKINKNANLENISFIVQFYWGNKLL